MQGTWIYLSRWMWENKLLLVRPRRHEGSKTVVYNVCLKETILDRRLESTVCVYNVRQRKLLPVRHDQCIYLTSCYLKHQNLILFLFAWNLNHNLNIKLVIWLCPKQLKLVWNKNWIQKSWLQRWGRDLPIFSKLNFLINLTKFEQTQWDGKWTQDTWLCDSMEDDTEELR